MPTDQQPGPAWHPKTGTSTVRPALCACELGPCGHCREGRHDLCLWVKDPEEAARIESKPPEINVMDRAGMVPVHLPELRVARVYLDRAGAHVWRCACHLDAHGIHDAPADGELDLWGTA